MSGDDAPLEARVASRHAPTVSVVVAWRGISKNLEALLAQLSSECEASGSELVLAHASTAAYRRRLQRLFPHIRLAQIPEETPLTELRERGAEAASGDILVLIDDELAAQLRSKPARPVFAWLPLEERESATESLDAGRVSDQLS